MSGSAEHVVDRAIASLCRGEFGSVHVTYNDHAANYRTAAEAEAGGVEFGPNQGSWVSEEEKARAIAHNTVWTVHWFPVSPHTSMSVRGSSLNVTLMKALFLDAEWRRETERRAG